MAGIYGNDPEDRYYERMLNRYLDETYGDDNKPDDESEDVDAKIKARKEDDIMRK